MEKKTVIITESGKLFCKNEIADNESVILWNPFKKDLHNYKESEVGTVLLDYDIYLRKPRMFFSLNSYFPGFSEITVESAEKIVERITSQIFLGDNPTEISKEADEAISQMLEFLGFRKKLDGYEYIKYALYLGIDSNKKLFMNLKKNIYNSIGKRFGKKPHTIERGIRFAIKDAYTCGNLSYTFSENPTNSEFLITVSQNLKY